MLDQRAEVGRSVGLQGGVFVFGQVVRYLRQLPALQRGDVQVFVDGFFVCGWQVAAAVFRFEAVADESVEFAGGWCQYVAQGAQVGVGVAGDVERGATFDAFAFYAVFYARVAGVERDVVDRQPSQCAQAFYHPVEADVGEPVIAVGTADIGVYTGEPDLFDVLMWPWRLVDRAFPQGRREGAALFVDGQGVQGDFDIGAEVDVVKVPARGEGQLFGPVSGDAQ